MINFQYLPDTEENSFRGKPISCKYCGFRFRILDEESKNNWTLQNLICPSCLEEYCVLPQTEKDLKKLQKLFIESGRDEKYGTQLYILLKKYIRSLILKHFTNVINDPEIIEYHSHCSTVKVMENYYSKPDFIVSDSFANYSMFKIKESIWHKSEHIIGDHSIHEQNDDGKDKYVVGVECKIKFVQDQIDNHKDYNEEITNYLVNEIYTHKDKKVEFKILLALNSFLNKGIAGSDKVFQKFGLEGKTRFNALLQRFKNKLTKDKR